MIKKLISMLFVSVILLAMNSFNADAKSTFKPFGVEVGEFVDHKEMIKIAKAHKKLCNRILDPFGDGGLGEVVVVSKQCEKEEHNYWKNYEKHLFPLSIYELEIESAYLFKANTEAYESQYLPRVKEVEKDTKDIIAYLKKNKVNTVKPSLRYKRLIVRHVGFFDKYETKGVYWHSKKKGFLELFTNKPVSFSTIKKNLR